MTNLSNTNPNLARFQVEKAPARLIILCDELQQTMAGINAGGGAFEISAVELETESVDEEPQFYVTVSGSLGAIKRVAQIYGLLRA